MRTIETTVTIAAPPRVVWQILVEFEEYQEWNPFIVWAEGSATVGATIKAHITPPGQKGMTHRPVIADADPESRLRWVGTLPIPGLFSGTHEFLLDQENGGTRLVHREEFTGLLVPFLGGTLRRTEVGFGELNRALKERAENRVS
ncbi:SRPBCC domain-containing protein [Lipingzhangella sp. LS1_29]|uniref:SRPBCC domain-containing protein n=1 Tax=Lipingzhangella rawalii TaxID=2055835 RepID=A0ABU2H6L2_9ACTN|nr:SRPBCC domain-containing protein [Lipingzhangella rawalii]MDS1270918.1 SRPBCC domain-containing protein [Lipingzhangella rawalii]